MKYIIVSFLLLFTAISAFATGKKDFLIEGKIGYLGAPAKVFLFYTDPVTNRPVRDSTLLDGGKFTFRGSIEHPVYAHMVYAFNGDIYYATAGDERRFYLDEGKITITGQQLFNAEIKGSATQDMLMQYFDIVRPVQQEIVQLRNDMDDIYKPYSREYRDSLDIRIKKLTKDYNDLSMGFVESHLNSILAVDMLSSQLVSHPEDEQVDRLFGQLNDEIKNSVPGQRLQRNIRNKQRIGTGHAAPNFTASTLQGETVSLSDYRGKWVLLTFESPTCDMCHREAQELTQLYAKYKEKGFEVIGFMIEEAGNKQQWKKIVDELKLPYTTVSDLKAWSSPIVDQYKISAVPENYLIDPHGLITGIDLYGYDLEDRLQKALK
jgi:peroxiredoxin